MTGVLLPGSFPIVMMRPDWRATNAWHVLAFAALYVSVLGHPSDIATDWMREWL